MKNYLRFIVAMLLRNIVFAEGFAIVGIPEVGGKSLFEGENLGLTGSFLLYDKLNLQQDAVIPTVLKTA